MEQELVVQGISTEKSRRNELYYDLKKRLQEQYKHDRPLYTKGKAHFIQEIINRASMKGDKEAIMIPIKLPKEDKNEIIKSVQYYFEQERSESIGDLGAEQLIDFFIKELGPYIYNKAIGDARLLVNERLSQIEDELYTLERPTQNRKK